MSDQIRQHKDKFSYVVVKVSCQQQIILPFITCTNDCLLGLFSHRLMRLCHLVYSAAALIDVQQFDSFFASDFIISTCQIKFMIKVQPQ